MDFTFAKKVQGKKLKDGVGSPYYVAPEVITGNYDKKCDIWSFGIVLYMLLKGKPPFKGNNYNAVIKEIIKKDLILSEEINLSKEAKDLLSKILVKNPNQRLTLDQIERHPFFHVIEQEKKESMKDVFKKVIQNMIKFRFNNSMQMTLYFYIVHSIIDRRKIIKLNDLFNLMDKNSNGKITLRELKKLRSDFDIDIEEDQLEKAFHNVDSNKTGFMLYEEYLASALTKKEIINEQVILTFFDHFDRDDSGYITLSEFKEIFTKVDTSLLERILNNIDDNNNGKITINEFRKALVEILSSK